MIDLFAFTDATIADNLKKDVNVVKIFVLNLVPLESHSEIKEADTIPKMFVALTPYKSFLNYKIVDKIASTFGSEENKKIMNDYVTAFNKFCRRSAFEIPRNVFPSLSKSKNDKILTMKLTSSGYMNSFLRDAILAKETIASIFGVKKWELHLSSIEDGCMCLRFLLSANAFAQLYPPTVSQLASLCKAGISIYEDVAPTTVERYIIIIIVVMCWLLFLANICNLASVSKTTLPRRVATATHVYTYVYNCNLAHLWRKIY